MPVETRCPCGFLRSVVPCERCPPVPRTRSPRVRGARASRSVRGARPRGQGEPNTMSGCYVCAACRIEKPLSEFYLSRTEKRGHQSRCKSCDNNMRRRPNAG